MRAQVSRLGMFSGISSQCLVDFFGQAPRYAFDPAQVLHRGCLHAVEAAELRQQLLAPRRTDPGDVFQLRAAARLGAPGAMADDGEAVRLVADLLIR
jgi:hypothetical protein